MEDWGQKKKLFEEQGYLVIYDFVTKEEIGELEKEMNKLIEEWDPSGPISIFSTKNQKAKTDEYFLTSGDKIKFFFEEDAFDEKGQLKADKSKSINKVGHNLHMLDPVFQQFSFQPKFKSLATDMLGFKRPQLVQSMYIFKQPKIGGAVLPHQDATFLYTDPPTCVALWFALEDATKSNGCLWVLPGSHKQGIYRRFVRSSQLANTVEFKNMDPNKVEPVWDKNEFIPLECPAGSLVLLHGATVHMSYENSSPKSRHAMTLHYIETVNTKYPTDNWLQLSDPNSQFPYL